MTAITSTSQLVSMEDYLDGEHSSDTKHEYLAGVLYAMAGGNNVHNRIATSVLGAFYGQLRGRPCQPFNSDTKVRVQFPTHTRFYYPDVQVVCHPNPDGDSFQDAPAVIVEVISESTRRTDEQEKREAYLSIPTLRAYILLERDTPDAVVWRRGGQGFAREVYHGRDAVIALPEIEARLAFLEIYGS